MNESNKHVLKLKELILKELQDDKVKIVMYGSRARGEQNTTSDVDIGFIPFDVIDKKKIVRLKEKIAELNIPYNVDFVNLSETSESFKNEILREAVLWKDYP